MTEEQKNSILKYLIEHQEFGTLDGKIIAQDMGLNVKHVMNLLEDFEQQGLIDCNRMAGYYFQTTVRLNGIEYLGNGGYHKSNWAKEITIVDTTQKMTGKTYEKPYVFIGSSAEGLGVAKAIQATLNQVCEPHIWSQGLFGLSTGTLENLTRSLEEFDFAVFVLTDDDITISRSREYNSPRDNVLLELGMFIGKIGRERTFMVVDQSAKIKLPSDLAGITPAFFTHPNKGTMMASVGAACYEIEQVFKKFGLKSSSSSYLQNDFEIDYRLITEYLIANSFTIISYERLLEMNPKYTKSYIISLLEAFPTHFRYGVANGKSGIALRKFIIPK